MCIRDSYETVKALMEKYNVDGIIHLAAESHVDLSLIHISEPTRLLSISYAVFCLKKFF